MTRNPFPGRKNQRKYPLTERLKNSRVIIAPKRRSGKLALHINCPGTNFWLTKKGGHRHVTMPKMNQRIINLKHMAHRHQTHIRYTKVVVLLTKRIGIWLACMMGMMRDRRYIRERVLGKNTACYLRPSNLHPGTHKIAPLASTANNYTGGKCLVTL